MKTKQQKAPKSLKQQIKYIKDLKKAVELLKRAYIIVPTHLYPEWTIDYVKFIENFEE